MSRTVKARVENAAVESSMRQRRDVSPASVRKYIELLQESTPDHKDIDFQKPITEKWWNFTDGPGIIKTTGEGSSPRVARN